MDTMCSVGGRNVITIVCILEINGDGNLDQYAWLYAGHSGTGTGFF
jgi:hypothetical protein